MPRWLQRDMITNNRGMRCFGGFSSNSLSQLWDFFTGLCFVFTILRFFAIWIYKTMLVLIYKFIFTFQKITIFFPQDCILWQTKCTCRIKGTLTWEGQALFLVKIQLSLCGTYIQIKGSNGTSVSVVISKTDVDGLNQVGGTDTVLSGGPERRWEVGIGEC